MMSLFVIAALVFVGYAVYAGYQSTPEDKSVPMRIWLSVIAAVASIGAAIASFFHSTAAIP